MMEMSKPENHEGGKLSVKDIGFQFVRSYYTHMNRESDKLHCFYADDSSCCHSEEGEKAETVKGQIQISAHLKKDEYQDVSVRITCVDSQECQESVIIQVLGDMSFKQGKVKKFAQTFCLLPQPGGYYVHNDMMRFLKDDFEVVDYQPKEEQVEQFEELEEELVQESSEDTPEESVPSRKPSPIEPKEEQKKTWGQVVSNTFHVPVGEEKETPQITAPNKKVDNKPREVKREFDASVYIKYSGQRTDICEKSFRDAFKDVSFVAIDFGKGTSTGAVCYLGSVAEAKDLMTKVAVLEADGSYSIQSNSMRNDKKPEFIVEARRSKGSNKNRPFRAEKTPISRGTYSKSARPHPRSASGTA